VPRTCTVCQHPQLAEINKALMDRESYRSIAQRFAASPDAMYRHKVEHMPAAVVKAHEAKEVAQADDLLAQLKGLRSKAVGILLAAEQAGDLRTALLAIREARACLETLLEVEGELNRRPQVNLTISAEWVEVRAVLMQALASYPDARAAVGQALLEVQHDRA